jgi:hypothetical protein
VCPPLVTGPPLYEYSVAEKVKPAPSKPMDAMQAGVSASIDRSGSREASTAPAAAQTAATDPRGDLRLVDGSTRHDGEMNRSERIGFWIYSAMGIFCAVILVAAAISAVLS